MTNRKEQIRQNITEKNDQDWIIKYNGAVCKFTSDSPEDAVIHDLNVPENIRGQGVGSDLISIAEEIIRDETDAKIIYASIGEDENSKFSTERFLNEKAGFEIDYTEEKEVLGKVVNAHKAIR